MPSDRGYDKGRFHFVKHLVLYSLYSCTSVHTGSLSCLFLKNLDLLAVRDPYNRDPYYERRSDPYLDRREYSRDRELYREMPPEYERDRYERERYHSREKDDR